MGAGHPSRHEAPLEAGYGQVFFFLSSPQARLAGPWSGGPRSCSWVCKGPSSASFLFAFQLSSLGRAVSHESGLGAPGLRVRARAEGTRGPPCVLFPVERERERATLTILPMPWCPGDLTDPLCPMEEERKRERERVQNSTIQSGQ